jgi:hypothetical protein
MATETVQQQIARAFLQKLADSKELDADKIDALGKLMAGGGKIKVDDLVRIFSMPAGGDLK